LEIPIQHRALWATGDVRLWADLDLFLKDNSGAWQPATFRIDTGSEMTVMPAFAAKQLGLPMPQAAVPGILHRPTGLAIRSGYLRFRIDGMDPTEYGTSCLFLGDPDTPLAVASAAFARNLLQPYSLLDQLRFALERDPQAGALYGTVILEKK
jgi:hypothetical protein